MQTFAYNCPAVNKALYNIQFRSQEITQPLHEMKWSIE